MPRRWRGVQPQRTPTVDRRDFLWVLAVVACLIVAWTVLASRAEAHFDLLSSPDAQQAQPVTPKATKASSGEPLAQVRNAAGDSLAIKDDTCEANMAIAAKQGLLLPGGWELHCVGPGLDWNGGSHWGVTCRYDECPEGAGPYISVSNPTYYVIAHELCHANFGDDELMADSCAAKHGASLDSSPYS